MLNIPDVRRALRDQSFAPLPYSPVSRRVALAGLAVLLPAWPMLNASDAEASKKKKKRKRRKKRKQNKKPETNDFGCLNVGQACNGNDDKCCSGICDGKKPKKGKKDTSRCVAHNVGSCQDAFDVCNGVPVMCGRAAACFKTTGNAPFCAGGNSECRPCQRDSDCVTQGFGAGAACVVCNSECALLSGGAVCFAAGA
ncbi:MAG: hypothetical protein KC442_16295 [Thermomicrobiales bacterium]|nr:hypothetical protein [Thermomicrobiales bacterium]